MEYPYPGMDSDVQIRVYSGVILFQPLNHKTMQTGLNIPRLFIPHVRPFAHIHHYSSLFLLLLFNLILTR